MNLEHGSVRLFYIDEKMSPTTVDYRHSERAAYELHIIDEY